jgi:hypothetical protein
MFSPETSGNKRTKGEMAREAGILDGGRGRVMGLVRQFGRGEMSALGGVKPRGLLCCLYSALPIFPSACPHSIPILLIPFHTDIQHGFWVRLISLSPPFIPISFSVRPVVRSFFLRFLDLPARFPHQQYPRCNNPILESNDSLYFILVPPVSSPAWNRFDWHRSRGLDFPSPVLPSPRRPRPNLSN